MMMVGPPLAEIMEPVPFQVAVKQPLKIVEQTLIEAHVKLVYKRFKGANWDHIIF